MMPTLEQSASASSMLCVVKIAPLPKPSWKLASIVSHTNLKIAKVAQNLTKVPINSQKYKSSQI